MTANHPQSLVAWAVSTNRPKFWLVLQRHAERPTYCFAFIAPDDVGTRVTLPPDLEVALRTARSRTFEVFAAHGGTTLRIPFAVGEIELTEIDGVAQVRIIHLSSQGSEIPAPVEAPRAAHYLLRLLLDEKLQDPLIGDLIEKHVELMVPTYGVRAANVWFWKQTLTSIWPIIRRNVAKALKFAWVVDWLRRTMQ